MLSKRATLTDYRALHRIADLLTPRLRRQLLETVRSLQGSLDVQRLVELLRAGDQRGLATFWRAVEQEVGVAVTPTVRLAIVAAGQHGARGFGGRFDLTNPHAVAAIETQVGTLVRDLSTQSQAALRAILRRGFEDGRTVEQMAQDIRAQVGLTERDAIAVANFRRAQRQAGVNQATVAQRVSRYQATLLRQRALRIARTETIRAANLGQQLAWEDARRDGRIPVDARRIWIITPDDRLCPLCESVPDMNPEGVGLTEAFRTPEGALLVPPLHPQCRCAVGLELAEEGSL